MTRAARRRRPIVVAAVFDALERRTLRSAVPLSTYEQYMVELINRARADPAAEAQRLGISLNEGLSAGTISTAAKQPLAPSQVLTGAIRDQVSWLRVNGLFQHEGSGGTTPTQRMTNAGYALSGTWGTGENLGVVMGSSLGDVAQRVETNYENLFLDEGYSGRGHRVNLLNGKFEEVGSGVASGAYAYNGQNWQAVLVGQDFAYTSGNSFLTGVAFTDGLESDNFYTPGEGMSGVTLVARSAGGQSYSTTTGDSGGFSLQVPDGTYTLTATDATTGKTATYKNVAVAGANVKRDFTAAQFASPASNDLPPPGADGTAVLADDGTLVVTGTGGRDTITVVADADFVTVTIDGGAATPFTRALVKGLRIDAGKANDRVTVSGDVGATIIGGAGDDELVGGNGDDLIYGNDGDDVIRAGSGDDTVWAGAGDDNVNGNGGKNYLHGEDGMDRLNGGGGRDFLYGEADNDRLYGNAGNDLLDGGGNNDRLYGGAGDDQLAGGNGIDRLYGDAGDDTLVGGKSTDVINGGADDDTLKDRDDIESVIGVEVG